MPDALRRDRRYEHEPAVRKLRAGIGLRDPDDELSSKRRVDVCRSQLAIRSEPLRLHRAAPNDVTLFHIEDVGEVGMDLDLNGQPNGAAAVVDDVVVLVDAALDGPVKPHGERPRFHRPQGVQEAVVRELEAGRERLDRRRVQQDRSAPVDEKAVAGNEPRVAGEEATLEPVDNSGVRLADQHAIIAIDRDDAGSDLDLEGHASSVAISGLEWRLVTRGDLRGAGRSGSRRG